ncbi:pyridoxal phosphate-dependent aminotransferase [Falsihalocynthiibacter arcticus]|uniref:aspartate transaminase n=1 Tax=Falsihalocynthiibacter arcticus TaxID=1579316 RepID=A0A126UZJ2_9RHOB|nr:pyridoxal phosphate-dependent aminotransferase [Falsihalocynthiibacter arcticus]AML51056.1 aspartate aminotransferase [Falsihalocynthiibacter arcticus]
MQKLARRITDTSPKSYGMVAKAAAVDHTNRDIIHLELGRPYHTTPTHIIDATVNALRSGEVHYSDLPGLPKFREAISDKLSRYNGIDVSLDDIIVTNGLTQASYAAFMALVDDGDEVILVEPYYPQHLGKIEMAGGKPVIVALNPENDYKLDAEQIEKAVTPRTKAIVLVNPCNPTGRVYTRDELLGVASLAQRHDLYVIADEVYDQIVFDGAEHISIASLPGMQERTVSMYAFTKSFAMDGWRLGYLTAGPAVLGAIAKIVASEVTHVNTFIQYGGIAALTGPSEILAEMVDDDKRKRDLVVARLNQMPGVTCACPEGTIYAFPNIFGTGLQSQEAADRLLQEADVVVESGAFYGQAGEGFLRVCYGSASYERIEAAMDRMQVFFNKL